MTRVRYGGSCKQELGMGRCMAGSKKGDNKEVGASEVEEECNKRKALAGHEQTLFLAMRGGSCIRAKDEKERRKKRGNGRRRTGIYISREGGGAPWQKGDYSSGLRLQSR